MGWIVAAHWLLWRAWCPHIAEVVCPKIVVRQPEDHHIALYPFCRRVVFPSHPPCLRTSSRSPGPSTSQAPRSMGRLMGVNTILLPRLSSWFTCPCSGAPGSAQYVLLQPQDLNPSSHADSGFTDGSDVLFSLYNEKAGEYDQKLAENWREDAQGIMLLVSRITRFHRPLRYSPGNLRVAFYQPQSQDSFHSLTSALRRAPRTSLPSISARSTNSRPVRTIPPSHRPRYLPPNRRRHPQGRTRFGLRAWC